MVWTAPHSPAMVESGVAYSRVAFVANLGHSATANHFQHYDVLLVPMAVGAGLGEVGHLGLLVTKEFGPRVRLGCVTTDLTLSAVRNQVARPIFSYMDDFFYGKNPQPASPPRWAKHSE